MFNKVTISLFGAALIVIFGFGIWLVIQTSNSIFQTTVTEIQEQPEQFSDKEIEVRGYIVRDGNQYRLLDREQIESVPVGRGILLDGSIDSIRLLTSYLFQPPPVHIIAVNPKEVIVVAVIGTVEINGASQEPSLQIVEISTADPYTNEPPPQLPGDEEIDESDGGIVIDQRSTSPEDPGNDLLSAVNTDGDPTAIDFTASANPETQSSQGNTSAQAIPIPGWLLFRDTELGFEIQHPADHELSSQGTFVKDLPADLFLIQSPGSTKQLEILLSQTPSPIIDLDTQQKTSSIQAAGITLNQFSVPGGVCIGDICGPPLIVLWGQSGNRHIAFTLYDTSSVSETHRSMIESFVLSN